MLYVYDKAICEDLRNSFNPDNIGNPVVKVTDVETSIGLAAQLKNDELDFPIVAMFRNDNISIDKNRTNFTALHRGIDTVFDKEHNVYYKEKVLPIELGYSLTVLTTNQADTDELVKELLFKYTQMYFLRIQLPYESRRQIRIGIIIDPDQGIQYDSGPVNYIKAGQLYQTIIPLKVEGAVLAHYTPVKLRNLQYEIDPSGIPKNTHRT